MSAKLGQQIVVRNVEGAGGTVAAGEVANADGDGYTVLMHHIGMSTAPALYPNLAYKPLEDFKTVGLVTTVPMTIVARKDFEPNTMQDLVTYVKAMGVDLTEVPYDGTGPALTDLVGGQVDFMCDQTTNTTGQIKADKVKAYAVTTPERVEALPDLPTTAEAGLEGVDVGVWHGVYVPAETPDDVVVKLTDALAAALTDQAVVAKLAELGATPAPAADVTPEAHRQLLQEQIDLWAPIIKEAGVTAGG